MKILHHSRQWMLLATILLAFCAAMWPLSVRSAGPAQDQEHFKNAFLDNSSAPYFVLVTIVDDRSGQSRTGCTEANFVSGAVYLEMNLPYDRAKQIALSNADHVFHFSKQKALDNVAFGYTQDDLERARNFIRAYGVRSLMTLSGEHRIALGNLIWSGALACAFIEQGLSARMDDMSGQIFAEP